MKRGFRTRRAEQNLLRRRHVLLDLARYVNFQLGSPYARCERPFQRVCHPAVNGGVIVPEDDWAKGSVVVDVFIAVRIGEYGADGFPDDNVGHYMAVGAVHAARDDFAGFIVKAFTVRSTLLLESHTRPRIRRGRSEGVNKSSKTQEKPDAEA
jgi:hypothetical protein